MKEKITNFNWPTIGHEPIIEFMQKSILNNKLSHAYLFIGPEHVGKSLIAGYFIGSLQCENQQKKFKNVPCYQCSACDQLQKRIHPDVYFIDKNKDKKNISIEQIRELEHKLSMRSFLTAYKIAVINDADEMTIDAANSLLKTLEEPTPKTIIILLATKINLIPLTIISRCQIIKFNLVSKKKIFDHLIIINNNKKEAQDLASLSQGRPGLAITYVQDKSLIEEYEDKIKTLLEIIGSNIKQKFNKIDKIIPKNNTFSEINESLISTMDIWSLLFRDLLLIKSQNTNNITNFFIKNKLILLAKRYKTHQLNNLLFNLEETKKLLSQNINPKILLENLVLNL